MAQTNTAQEAATTDKAEAALKARLVNSLKDPSSAQFKNLKVVSFGQALCGEVNAKNSFGGYIGFRPFVVDGERVYLSGDKDDDIVAYALWFKKASDYGCK